MGAHKSFSDEFSVKNLGILNRNRLRVKKTEVTAAPHQPKVVAQPCAQPPYP